MLPVGGLSSLDLHLLSWAHAAGQLSSRLPAGRPGDRIVAPSTGNEFAFILMARNGGIMTSKEKVLTVVNSLDDDASVDDVIERLYLLRKIELGIAQADDGDVMEHDHFMAELDREDVN